ncbi:uncharacterized protein VTP21DRAFT_4542, partial [Calcarisporiella thermophila]|uniref:uncharacterized protein n=1 Tax=Calcarisporiella thermophila TaxID=911321 RepID=UPI003744841B
ALPTAPWRPTRQAPPSSLPPPPTAPPPTAPLPPPPPPDFSADAPPSPPKHREPARPAPSRKVDPPPEEVAPDTYCVWPEALDYYYNYADKTPTSPPAADPFASSFSSEASRSIASSTTADPRAPQRKLKLNYGQDMYVITVPTTIPFSELMAKIELKIRRNPQATQAEGDRLWIKFQDEDGDMVTMNSDEDVRLAFASIAGAVHLYVS